MNISENLSRLSSVKSNIKSAIIAKGVTVGDDFTTYASAISSIETRGSFPEGTTFAGSYFTRLDDNISEYCKTITTPASASYSDNTTSCLFEDCTSLTSVSLEELGRDATTLNVSRWFYYCSSLTSLSLNFCSHLEGVALYYILQGCSSLISVSITGHVHLSYNNYLFPSYGNYQLSDFYIDGIYGDYPIVGLSCCTMLTVDSLMNVINALEKGVSSKKLYIGSINLAKLTNDQIAIATNKGWILS